MGGLQDLMNAMPIPAGEPVPGKTYIAEGWVYRDLPNMLPEFFDKLVGAIGDDNIVWLTKAVRTWPDGQITERGQLLISPAGMDNLRAYRIRNHP